MNADLLLKAFADAGQAQVFRFWDELDSVSRKKLLLQAADVDLTEIDRLNHELVFPEKHQPLDLEGLKPAPYIAQPAHGGKQSDWNHASEVGESALQAGRVACFTVAGGQGTRLGYDGPKGTFPVTPVNSKSLFQVFAEKIQAASLKYGHAIPWFIMTSHVNHEATEGFFKKHDYFGLGGSNVIFFPQGRMPAVDPNGKIMMAGKDEIALSPDGHGGSLRALVRSGAARTMKERGIDIISYFQVDNPLVQCIDPAFIGFHVIHGSEMSSKMIPKAYAGEKVGHFCVLNDKTIVIEYSDMPASLQELHDASGALTYLAGSIAIHILSREFVERAGSGDESCRLPFHRADKKITTISETGNPVFPEIPNGIKFEMFVFDALPFADNPVIIETFRDDDFSPVKNAQGLDSPETCRRDQMRQWVRWFDAVGVVIPGDKSGNPNIELEVSPLFACSLGEFVNKWNQLTEKPVIQSGLYLE